jgi:hypothetical protein
MRQLNRKPLAARDHNNYLPAYLTDALLEEGSKEGLSDNSNANNNNDNRSFAPTISIIKEEDRRTPPRVLNITLRMRHGLITTSPYQLQ